MKRAIRLQLHIEVDDKDPTRCAPTCPYLCIDGDGYLHCPFGGPDRIYGQEGKRTADCLKAEAATDPADATHVNSEYTQERLCWNRE